jgi:hypothetical protein
MLVHWLIDADMFDHYRDDLVEAIRKHGQEVKLVRPPSPPYRWDDVGCSYRDTFPKDCCVVAHGDIELVTRIHRESRWTPGAFCSVDNFRCSSYLCHFGEYWINADYMMLPFGELSRQSSFLFDKLGRSGRIFVRPDSPLKLFTGQIATDSTFEKDLEFMGFYEFPAESIVVVSSPKAIVNEWRFVVAAGRVVAGCLYQQGKTKMLKCEYDHEAFQLASTIASSGYEPDPVWVVDICETSDGEFRLLEIGGFSFSDLYACDKTAVVSAVSEVAKLVWQGAYVPKQATA